MIPYQQFCNQMLFPECLSMTACSYSNRIKKINPQQSRQVPGNLASNAGSVVDLEYFDYLLILTILPAPTVASQTN